jgi:hypothetical protein
MVMFTEPSRIYGRSAATPVVVNVDRIESFSPRLVCHEDDKLAALSDKRWVEDGTWITMNSGVEDGGVIHVVEHFDLVVAKLKEAKS